VRPLILSFSPISLSLNFIVALNLSVHAGHLIIFDYHWSLSLCLLSVPVSSLSLSFSLLITRTFSHCLVIFQNCTVCMFFTFCLRPVSEADAEGLGTTTFFSFRPTFLLFFFYFLTQCDTMTPQVFQFIGPSNDGRRHGRGTYLFVFGNSRQARLLKFRERVCLLICL
jgi:hypothetical protein